jgi:hypothetical protein
MESPAPTKPASKALGNLRERMIALSVSVSVPFKPRRDWRRMKIERRGLTFTLPIVTEKRMTAMSKRPRRVDVKRTFFRVTIFISQFNDQ